MLVPPFFSDAFLRFLAETFIEASVENAHARKKTTISSLSSGDLH